MERIFLLRGIVKIVIEWKTASKTNSKLKKEEKHLQHKEKDALKRKITKKMEGKQIVLLV